MDDPGGEKSGDIESILAKRGGTEREGRERERRVIDRRLVGVV